MVAKLFLTKKINFFRFSANGIVKRRLCSTDVASQTDALKYLLVLDFEATCERKRKTVQEIIEFPCIKLNLKTRDEEATFHHYVRPTFQPILSDFCVQLTGILQEMVDESKPFPEVYQLFEEWREKEGLTVENSLYVTTGDWDLGHMIKVQCQLCSLPRPPHMYQWADLKKTFANNQGLFLNSFIDVLRHYGMEFEGRPHSGIVDCRNMVRVIKKMLSLGIEFKPTSRVDSSTSKVTTLNPNIQQIELNDCSQGPTFKPVIS